jgi:hypothetical protein
MKGGMSGRERVEGRNEWKGGMKGGMSGREG